jgi:glycosyltransferase involved in cell wall biosynthesis
MILYLNSEKGQFSFNKKDYLLRAAKRLGIDYVKDIKEADGNVEYLLNIQPCDLKSGSKWTGIWHIDVSLNSSLIHHYNEMDTVFVASSVGILPYEKQIILFQAMDPELHRRIPEVEQTYDFAICGTGGGEGGYLERMRVYKLMMDNFTCNECGNGFVPEEYVMKYNSGKVQLVQPCLGTNGLGMCAQRFFECLGIGAVLCDWTPDLDLLGLIEGEDYFSYKNDEELISKMDLLLKDEELRNKMFANGRQKALNMHTFEHRLVTILNLLHENFAFVPTLR